MCIFAITKYLKLLTKPLQSMKKNLILAFALTIITTFSVNHLSAQTKEDAGNAFNAALELSKTNMAGAVVKMEEVVTMCNALGADGDTIKMSATTVIPVWQYNVGNNFLKVKDYNKATVAFEKSDEYAAKYDDENIKLKSEDILVKLYASKGNTLLKADKADEAIAVLDKSLKIDPANSKALYAKGLAYKKKGDTEKLLENMELSLASATKDNDTVIADAARSTIALTYYQDGKTLFQKKSYEEAIEKFNSALKYDDTNKELFYLLAVSNNNIKKYDEAIAAGNSGLPLEDQSNVKMARFYYEIAKAYEGKQDTSNACDSYKKSAFGTFAQSANYQMKTVLKCQ